MRKISKYFVNIGLVVDKLTIYDEQLTIVVSLRDESELYDLFPKETP